MTIIFDKNKALQNKEQIHKEVRKENSLRKTKKIATTALFSLLCAGVVITAFFTKNNLNLKGILFAALILSWFLLPSLFKVLKEDVADTVFPNSRYSPDVQYLLATKNKNVFDYNLIEYDNYADLSFSLQNREGKTERASIRGLRKKSSEKVKEVTVDLETSTVYIPSL